MNNETWAAHSHAIISLLDGATAEQLQEMIADIDDLLTAQIEEEINGTTQA